VIRSRDGARLGYHSSLQWSGDAGLILVDPAGAAQSCIRLLRLSPLHLLGWRYARALFRPRARKLMAGIVRQAITPRRGKIAGT
jgi:hypothetical protein